MSTRRPWTKWLQATQWNDKIICDHMKCEVNLIILFHSFVLISFLRAFFFSFFSTILDVLSVLSHLWYAIIYCCYWFLYLFLSLFFFLLCRVLYTMFLHMYMLLCILFMTHVLWSFAYWRRRRRYRLLQTQIMNILWMENQVALFLFFLCANESLLLIRF